jgi:DNA-binding transcriptional LysR family regulator
MSLGDPLPGRDLAAFVTAIETGSIQGAADALQLTQSAATKRLQALERRVGRALLERGAYGVRPTEAGEVLYPLAREALAVLTRAEAALSDPGDAPALRIHASRTIGAVLLPEWLAWFRAAGPRARVSVTITNSDEVVRALHDGAAEIGFVEGTETGIHGVDELVVGHDEIRVVVAREHPWARLRAVAREALRGEALLVREEGSGTRAVAFAALEQAGVKLQPALEVSSAEGLKRAVAAGGFTLLSDRVIASEVDVGALVALPITGVDMRRSLRAVRRTRPALQGPAGAFWRWLERTIAPRA